MWNVSYALLVLVKGEAKWFSRYFITRKLTYNVSYLQHIQLLRYNESHRRRIELEQLQLHLDDTCTHQHPQPQLLGPVERTVPWMNKPDLLSYP